MGRVQKKINFNNILIGLTDFLLPIYSKRRLFVKKILAKLNITRSSVFRNLGLNRQTAKERFQLLYAEKLQEAQTHLPGTYVPISGENIDHSRVSIKTIAFYLPQFHPIPENDKTWGKGFTEWTNVTKALPYFSGHYQPRLPGDFGFYDLRLKENQQKQIDLAKKYGISGFCYHHYWFAGKRLLETPFNKVLRDKSLDFPFCLCWANENWTKRWDGGDNDIIIAQNHSKEDDIKFIKDIEGALKDPRYIRVDGKPLLIVYMPGLLPDPAATADRWRAYAKASGIGDLSIYAAATFGFTDYKKIKFDGIVQFPPHNYMANEISHTLNWLNPEFKGSVCDYEDYVNKATDSIKDDLNTIPCVMISWDNTARKGNEGIVFHNCSPSKYRSWLKKAYHYVLKHKKREKIVFINAWNEWAEGTYLEPDRKFGYAYLHATANAIREFYTTDELVLNEIQDSKKAFRKKNNSAIVFTLYYEDLIDDFLHYYKELVDIDLFISLPSHISRHAMKRLKTEAPLAYLDIFPNKGRDILPFLTLFKIVREKGYLYFGKIHSKKTTYRKDGSNIRKKLFNALLSKGSVARIRNIFHDNQKIGIVAPAGTLLSLSELDYSVNNVLHLKNLLTKMGCKRSNINFSFIGGSMFWARVDAMDPVFKLYLTENDFEEELGQIDGTLAHAIERLFLFSANLKGYTHAVLDDVPDKTEIGDHYRNLQHPVLPGEVPKK